MTRHARVEGRCRGALLARWAAQVERRFGAAALGRVRARSGVERGVVPDAPLEKDWYPVWAQLALTDAIVAECFDGDTERAVPALLADARDGSGAIARALLRTLGPGRVLARAGELHPHAYDVGTLAAQVSGDQASLRYEGAALFAEPTWQLLSTTATRGLVELSGRKLLAMRAEPSGAAAFLLRVSWT